MSVILAKASQLKSEIRLAQAVSQFEADLSNERKTIFRDYRRQSLDTPPDPSHVMRLTAEIDRRVSGKVGGRCFGPRFTNFLQAVQQFAALGDVVVGGSQNIIACGVWSLVRMTFLSVGNFLSYLDKLSDLFMRVGRTAPRYQNMAMLYPRSKRLQSHLSEYFIVVVGLCHQLLKFSQKSTLRQVASTMNDSDIRTYQSDLDHWANSISEEMNLLMAVTIEKETKENSRFRALSSNFIKSQSHENKLATNLRVLNFCSKYDYETTWKQTRKVGNATTFYQDPKYQEWKDATNSCTLIYTGKLGSGKSVLLANIIDDLNIHVQSKNMVVAYFFCRHDILESLSPRTVIGSLARQLLRAIPDLAILSKLCDETRTILDFETVHKLLKRALPSDHKTYFVLDGLDECDRSERETLVRQLQDLQQTLTFLLCVSFRIEPDSPLELGSTRFAAAKVASIPDDNPDITTFIDEELESCLKSRALVIGEPTLILEIHDALVKGSQGMFLWVSLQIRSLCAMKTDQAIRDALCNLPKDLSETFSRILQRSEGPGESYQIRILQLIMASFRPLTIYELREALSVVVGNANWDSSRLLNDIYSTLSCCGCVLTVDEEESTVRFVHHSVKQFLLCDFEDLNKKTFTIENAQRMMADTIVTYLSYGVFGTELSTMKVPRIAIGSAPSGIIRSTLAPFGHTQSLALKLLKSKKRANFDIGNTLANARKHLSHHLVDEFHFYSYAKVWWLRHIFYISGQKLAIYNLLQKLIERNELMGKLTAEDGWELLIWATLNGNEIIVKLLIDSGKIDANSKDTSGRTLLAWAAANGHESVVRLLVERDDIEVDSKNIYYGRTPLSWAAGNGHEAVVRVLVNHDNVEADSKDVMCHSRTPLSWAAGNGHEAVVRQLIERDDVEVNSKDKCYKRTPLSWASGNGHEAVVRLLIDCDDVEADSRDASGQTPLSWAAGNGHEAVVRLLVDRDDVEADSRDWGGQTPLSWAAKRGYEIVARLLVERDDVTADSNDASGQTPLSWAAGNGHEAVVKLLVDRDDVEADSRDWGGQTPLSWAAEGGHEMVVRLLVDRDDVKADSRDGAGQTPLSWAAVGGHEMVARLLVERDDVIADTKDETGQTPLSWAAKNGHKAVVKLLVDRDDFEADSNDNSWRNRMKNQTGPKTLTERAGTTVLGKQIEVKMLILGTSESGKSTLLNEIRQCVVGNFSYGEMVSFSEIVWSNIIQGIRIILEAMEYLEISLQYKTNEYHAQTIYMQPANVEHSFPADIEHSFPAEVRKAVMKLWADEGVQEAYRRWCLYQVLESVPYFADHIERLAAPRYMPSEEDIFRSIAKTTGIFETAFEFRGSDVQFRVFDMGGTRLERKKWIHTFEHVNSIVFTVDASAYCRLLFEDKTVNRMQEQLMLWDSIISSSRFTNTGFILVFTKIDRLPERLKLYPVSAYLPDFKEPESIGMTQLIDSYLAFLKERFMSLMKSEESRQRTRIMCVDLIHINDYKNPAVAVLEAARRQRWNSSAL